MPRRATWVWPKRCGCGATHGETEWAALPHVGVNVDLELEFRNCGCGSTIAVHYRNGGADATARRGQA